MKDVFIIVTGGSLNDINTSEKDYIQSCPVIASGHYLLYWETIGVIPDHYVFSGNAWDHPTHCIVPGGLFYGACEVCKAHKLNTKFYVLPETKIYLDGGDIPRSTAHPNLGKNLKPCPADHRVESIAINVSELPSHHGLNIWAKTLTDKFWFNSGIGTAINLATVLYPGYNIKLLGNDGGSAGGYFYNRRECDKSLITVMSSELTHWASILKPGKLPHYNMNNFNTKHAVKMVETSGGALFNCNKRSYFTVGGDKYIEDIAFMENSQLNTSNLFNIPHSNILSE